MGSEVTSKFCRPCARALPLDAFGKNRASKDGLQTRCKECAAAWARENRPRKLELPPATGDDEKWCRRCRRVKSLSAFGRHATTADGKQTYCRECFADIYREKRLRLGLLVKPLEVPEGHKFCRGCQRILPHSEWSRRDRSADGYHFRCKECVSHKDRSDHLARSYGLTVDDVERMLAEQGGLCAICRTAGAVHVDHDHKTGEVRGLLCFRCNAALGQLGDDAAVVRRAADYLEAADRAEPPLRAATGSDTRSLIELAWQERFSQTEFGTAS